MRLLLAEFLGTALLLAVVVGSGIMGERLAGGNVAVALLANSLATGFALPVLILVFAEASGSHFNPVVTLVSWCRGELRGGHLPLYLAGQFSGGVAGVALAHVMFDAPLFAFSGHVRFGWGQWVSEAIATFGLVFLILVGRIRRLPDVPYMVGAYIAAAYWFTASTSFANPAVTVARSLTNTFAGIRPRDAPWFIVAQCAGALLAVICLRVVYGAHRSPRSTQERQKSSAE